VECEHWLCGAREGAEPRYLTIRIPCTASKLMHIGENPGRYSPQNVGAAPGCSDKGKGYVRMTRSNCRTFKPASQAGQATTRAEKV
jgi:hypothetical protein